MKRFIAVILTLVLLVGLSACGGNAAQETETVPVQQMPASALEILENVWADYSDDEKFPVMGGDMVNMVDGAPGAYGLEDADYINYLREVDPDRMKGIPVAYDHKWIETVYLPKHMILCEALKRGVFPNV